jgi:hypothetical protein
MSKVKFKIKYVYGLSSFLDEKNIKWKKISVTENFDVIEIIMPRNTTVNDVWDLAIEFKEWSETIANQYN